MQRIMMNAVLNAGAILFEGKYTVVARVEGADRKSFFAVAQSDNGIDGWRFWDEPVTLPNGWIANEDGKVFIYYASADTRLHVATTTVAQLLDYCLHTPEDGLSTTASVETIKALVAKNKGL